MSQHSEKPRSVPLDRNGERTLSLTVSSFGYKEGVPPPANMVFDVRFLKNPYWVEELRPLTGLDDAVQKYVLEQLPAQQFLSGLVDMLKNLMPQLRLLEVTDFSIAFGCTGGQHRSATLAEELSKRLSALYPDFKITIYHRELSEKPGLLQRKAMAED